jgi:hypothetical protein
MVIVMDRAKHLDKGEDQTEVRSARPARVLPLHANRRATPLPTVTISGVSDDWLRWHAIESGKREGDY